MGVEKFVFHVGMAEHQIAEAIAIGISGGGTEQAIDHGFMRLADSARSGLAYRQFALFVHEQMAARRRHAQQAAPPHEVVESMTSVEPEPARKDEVKAVEGHTGIYTRTRADGSLSFVAKWPDASKTSGTATKGGFESVEAAEAFRNAQVNERIAA